MSRHREHTPKQYAEIIWHLEHDPDQEMAYKLYAGLEREIHPRDYPAINHHLAQLGAALRLDEPKRCTVFHRGGLVVGETFANVDEHGIRDIWARVHAGRRLERYESLNEVMAVHFHDGTRYARHWDGTWFQEGEPSS
jgi:hypothetical protein